MKLDTVISMLRKQLDSADTKRLDERDRAFGEQILDWLVELREYKHLYPPVPDKLIPKRRKPKPKSGAGGMRK